METERIEAAAEAAAMLRRGGVPSFESTKDLVELETTRCMKRLVEVEGLMPLLGDAPLLTRDPSRAKKARIVVSALVEARMSLWIAEEGLGRAGDPALDTRIRKVLGGVWAAWAIILPVLEDVGWEPEEGLPAWCPPAEEAQEEPQVPTEILEWISGHVGPEGLRIPAEEARRAGLDESIE